jgi:4-hydroxy-3-methylbut-2-enyl diphosphate reductase
MIHNPDVNRDLEQRGVRFLMHTSGEPVIPWDELRSDDIVIVPAFGTTIEIQRKLQAIGIEPYAYDTTCPFVERVWNKAAQIGKDRYTVVVHGKPAHEETRATFSHSRVTTPTVIVRDMNEAQRLGSIILGGTADRFYELFKGQYSDGFDPSRDLERIGVVNQTTMLASDTQAIADYLRGIMMRKYGLDDSNVSAHFADTRDTLCYATNDNQNAVYGLIEEPADLAIVAGGYNSSNTSHLVELCERQLPTYYISSADKLLSATVVQHWDFHRRVELTAEGYLPKRRPVVIALTSGASCPDAVVESIVMKMLSFFEGTRPLEDAVRDVMNSDPA